MNSSLVKIHPLVTYANDVSAITQSLFKNTPITLFRCGRLYANGKHCGLISDAQWAEILLEKDYYLCELNSSHLVSLADDYFLYRMNETFFTDQHSINMCKHYLAFNYGRGIVII